MKKILCIHGIGGKDSTIDKWSIDWKNTIIKNSGFSDEIEFNFLPIDDLFEESIERVGRIKYVQAIGKFISSWVSTSIDEKFRSKGILDTINWYAGMPAQFATDELLREKLQERIGEAIHDFKPNIIYAHSLGTLICYDFLRQKSVKNEGFNLVLITSGSQIGHPAMRQLFGGVILPLKVKYWVNLHNENDRVFASRLVPVCSDNFLSVETPFEYEKINHEVLKYMSHENAVNQAWSVVVSQSELQRSRDFALTQLGIKSLEKQKKGRKPNRKALLIGINNYPDERNRLEGCVNDVYRISEVLQEYGFSPEEIRVTLNERATASEIRNRLNWLLNDAKEGDLRFFFYSGHGAQIPSSHADYEIDSNDECLVPYDFDWTIENAFTDKEFLELYSQLSLNVNFVSVLDCCHSGGMTRGNGMKAKGLTPPDDIRHREIKWDEEREMWIPRNLALKKDKLFNNKTSNSAIFTGLNGKTNKLGRAIPLWNDFKEHEIAKKKYGVVGAYMPILLEACDENESAYEYRHGVTSFGAFTYSLTKILRQHRKKGKLVSFNDLMKATSLQLKELKYDQTPVLVGPKMKTEGKLPFPMRGTFEK